MSIFDMAIALNYGLIGFSGALALLVFIGGLSVYIARLGTERRVEGIHIMQWGVTFAVVTLLLIGLLRFIPYAFA